jgi:hypothetical protein
MTYDFRMTIRGGAARLVDWSPWLARTGPLSTLLHARGRAGVAIADLTVAREDEVATEVVADFVTGESPEARAVLCDWAAEVGYRRLWLPGAVVDLPPFGGGEARVRCTGCRVVLTDGDAEFWLAVRRLGRFPGVCPLCGSDLPQWTVRRAAAPVGEPGRVAHERSAAWS